MNRFRILEFGGFNQELEGDRSNQERTRHAETEHADGKRSLPGLAFAPQDQGIATLPPKLGPEVRKRYVNNFLEAPDLPPMTYTHPRRPTRSSHVPDHCFYCN